MGIIKPNGYSVLGLKDNNLVNLARSKCLEINNTCLFPLLENIDIINSDITGSIFNFEKYNNLKISLTGFHQIENAIVALKTIQTLTEWFDIKDEDIYEGLLNTKWLGRFETLSDKPLVIVDGAHNIDGITRVAEFVKTLDYKNKRCIFACSDDKEKEKILSI